MRQPIRRPRARLTTAASSIPLLLVMLIACNTSAEGQEDPATLSLEQRAAYAIGANMAQQLGADGIDLDVDYLVKAINDVRAGKTLLLDDAGMGAAMQELQVKQRETQQARAQKEATQNLADGEAFLTQNRSVEGVVETASGLQYKVITAGEGPKPTTSDKVSVHYTGTTLDGTVFDSSVQAGRPVTFGVTQVVPGFSEALQLMSPGAKYQVWIKGPLGYGINIRPGSKFGPNELLVFEMELLEIVQ